MKLFLILLCFLSLTGYTQDIHRYEMYSDHFDVDRYTKQYQRTFDSIGIIKQKDQYHALTISLYGILCYDKYIDTKDEYYLKQFVNQYQYFQDSSRYDSLFEGKGIGLPYHFKFHDLTPPWYSGLTQGIAVSYLLRYAYLKKDTMALDMAKKVAYPMFVPVENGGTLSRNPEGGLWIEEYPNSKRSMQVLNGFINGLVGIKEYLDFFPEDTLAQRVHNEVYDSFKNTINAYDNNRNWSTYDRSNKAISVYYLRIQLTQLDHLYSLYRDEFLRKQMSVWSKMMIGKKDKEFTFYKYPDYSYGTVIDPNIKDTDYDLSYEDIYQRSIKENINIKVRNKKHQLIEMDNGFHSKERMMLIPDHSLYSIRIDLDGKIRKTSAFFYFVDGGKSEIEFNQHLEFQEFIFDQEFDSVEIVSDQLFGKKINLKQVSFYDYRSYDLPMFASYLIPGEHRLEGGKTYKIECEKYGIEGAVVFYRFAPLSPNVTKSKWYWYQNFNLSNGTITPKANGFYEFFISIPIHSEKILLRNINIIGAN